jgi:hypothetical protein
LDTHTTSEWPAALDAGFGALTISDYRKISTFFASLKQPLADLNALGMLAWRTSLNLHFLIEEEVLYVLANCSGEPTLWGPPIGENVTMGNIGRAFDFLKKVQHGKGGSSIRYLWSHYALWKEIMASPNLRVSANATEYLYSASNIAALSTPAYKKKRYIYEHFKRNYDPLILRYTTDLAPQCLALMVVWEQQKAKRIDPKYLRKFESEVVACETALRDRLQLSGVVALVDNRVEAFSIGAPHGQNCFNCMFEKSNLEIRGISTFVFAELAKSCDACYEDINAGDDCGIEYLANAKRLWKPRSTQINYLIRER